MDAYGGITGELQKDFGGMDMGAQRKGAGVASAYLMPHPPIAVPDVGRGREAEIAKTLESMREAARRMLAAGPETIFVVSPHAPIAARGRRVNLCASPEMAGDLRQFGAPKAKLRVRNDLALAARIADEAARAGVPVEMAGHGAGGANSVGAGSSAGAGSGDAGRGANAAAGAGASGAPRVAALDHGTLVPLWFVSQDPAWRAAAEPPAVVLASAAFLPNRTLYEFGRCVARAALAEGRRAVLIASGDLSHKLTHDGPYGFHRAGPEFDAFIEDCVRRNDVEKLLATDESFLDDAAQCGFYGILMLYGAMRAAGAPLRSEVYSHEGPFGVGYCIARVSISQNA